MGPVGRSLGHTFATRSVRAHSNLRAVQELPGHSSVTTTQRYTHMSAEDLRQQVAESPGSRGPLAAAP